MTARAVLDGIKARLAFPVENLNFIEQAAAENQLLKVDMPRLTAAVDALLAIAESPDIITHHPKGDKTFYVEAHRIRAAIENALKEGQ